MSYAHEEDLNDIPPYPSEWSGEQRIAAYWHALNFTRFPGKTEGWFAVWKSLEREQDRRHRTLSAAAAVQAQEEQR